MSGTKLRNDDGLVGGERATVKRNPAEAGLEFGDDLSGKRDTSSGRGTPFIYHPPDVARVISLTDRTATGRDMTKPSAEAARKERRCEPSCQRSGRPASRAWSCPCTAIACDGARNVTPEGTTVVDSSRLAASSISSQRRSSAFLVQESRAVWASWKHSLARSRYNSAAHEIPIGNHPRNATLHGSKPDGLQTVPSNLWHCTG